MHMAAVSRQTLSRLSHECRRNAMFGPNRFHHVSGLYQQENKGEQRSKDEGGGCILEQTGLVSHLLDLTKLQCLTTQAHQ